MTLPLTKSPFARGGLEPVWGCLEAIHCVGYLGGVECNASRRYGLDTNEGILL